MARTLCVPIYKAVLAWGFSSGPAGCEIRYGPGMVVPTPPPRCIEGDLVNAHSGRAAMTEFTPIEESKDRR